MTTSSLLPLGGFLGTVLALATILADPAGAQESAPLEKACETNLRACEIRSRLSAFEPNYVIWQTTDGDESAIEAHYSVRYMLTRPHCRPGHDMVLKFSLRDSKKCIKSYDNRLEFFLAYTGEFDFYLNTRASGPVINRISNPGIYLRKYFADQRFSSLMLSLEHRSNGQVTEIDETDSGVLKTQTAFANDNHEYFDGISRGSNYFELEAKFKPSEVDRLYASIKKYINQDSAVNWGPTAANNPKIADYDRIRLLWTRQMVIFDRQSEFALEWLIGDRGLETDSFDIDFMYPISFWGADFPFFIKYHGGPMNTLSDYTREQDTLGFGIKLKI